MSLCREMMPPWEIKAEMDRLTAENERLRAALERIREWSDAYPLDVFPEPDWEKSEAALSAAGLSLSAISAANMRHVISGVGSIARAALEEKP